MPYPFAANEPQTPEQREAALRKARELLQSADRVLIGAGAGLSTAAGLDHGGKRFQEEFPAFVERYGMTDSYSGGFFPFPTLEDLWAFWGRNATVNCLGVDAMALYRALYDWARTRDYFVITTNVDEQFEKAGFSPERIFATQGSYAEIQCVTGEHGIRRADELYARIEEDTGHGARTRISDSSLVPVCDVCGRPMTTHLRVDDRFVQDDAWYDAEKRYRSFVAEIPEKPTLLLELGVGFNTPVWIRMPFERIAKQTGSPLVRMNFDSADVDPSLEHAVGIQGDMAQTLPVVLGG